MLRQPNIFVQHIPLYYRTEIQKLINFLIEQNNILLFILLALNSCID
jgi:hypothetical protein